MKDVLLVVKDEAENTVVSIQLYSRTKDDIENAIASLEAVYLFCTVEEVYE